jgi:hypothetical protein
MRTAIEIVAVPGSPEHAPTRKQLLDQVDGIVLVIDCEPGRMEENLASLEELQKTLQDYARSIDEMPLVVMYNKRDLCDGYAIEELHRRLGLADATVFETTATEGTGLLPALSTISKKVIRFLREQSASPMRTPLSEEAAITAPEPIAESVPARPDPVLDPEPMPASTRAGSPHEAMEDAILAEMEHPERGDIDAASNAASALLDDQPWLHEPDEFGAPLGARINSGLSIVSVGEATRADERTVRIPLVLGDEEGETSPLVLTIRLDPLIEDGTD